MTKARLAAHPTRIDPRPKRGLSVHARSEPVVAAMSIPAVSEGARDWWQNHIGVLADLEPDFLEQLEA